jgi:UDPglucose 6-dehydrogenase
MKKYKITIVGAGYVGMSLATLLSKNHTVVVLDTDSNRVNLINNRKSTVADTMIEKYLRDYDLDLSATTDEEEALQNSNFFIIATPTNYDPETNYFDTSSVVSVASRIVQLTDNGLIIIKSTIPVGFTSNLNDSLQTDRIVFSPEFLREGKALEDNLYPSRIIVGSRSQDAEVFTNLLLSSALKKDVPVLHMGSDEAEAVKLFANTYLAMRVAYFNELDSYAMHYGLSSKDIVLGASLDSRIGNYYNNPSFGYGGYCLPKDTKQLLANFKDVPQNLIKAIVDSNSTRKQFLVDQVLLLEPKVVGIFGLAMKQGSDNFRFSAIQGIIEELLKLNLTIIIYEPALTENTYMNCKIVNNLKIFTNDSEVILANRIEDELKDVEQKVVTRDIFHLD